ncbi:MAG: hypothetical protein U0234_13980 [Sandaracinus sp.]
MAASSGRLARAGRALRAWVVYRADQLLGLPPIAQLLLLALAGAAIIFGFAGLELALHPHDADVPDESAALWWTLTHFLDGGTMASDDPYRRGVALATTVAGILLLALVTAALTSKMGERIGDLRSGLNPVVERGHFLVLGFDATVPLVARELARSKQRSTLVVLTNDDKDRVEAALRSTQRVVGSRLRVVVRTGDPRTENALLRVSAHRARAALIVPSTSLDDESSVEWSLAALLALRRVVGERWPGRALVLARHEEAVDLLRLAAEPDVAGPGALAAEVIAADAVIAAILAQSTREDGVYAVLRHILAFDGCELYLEPVDARLAGRSFDYAHASLDRGIAVGAMDAGGRIHLSPPPGGRPLAATDRLIVLTESLATPTLGASLPTPRPIAPESIAPRPPQHVALLGWATTAPHVCDELASLLPNGSTVHLAPGEMHARAAELAQKLETTQRRVKWVVHARSGADLAHTGHPIVCGADSVVVLGQHTSDGDHGDATALAMLLRIRHGLRSVGTPDRVRIVTEVRDPRSASHVAPRPGDSIVSSDIVAMLLAQELLDPRTGPIYRELITPGGAAIELRRRAEYVPDGDATFAEVLAAARRRGEIAIGFHPDPRRTSNDPELDRRRLEEGDPILGPTPWLNPPRETLVPSSDDGRIVVITRRP